MSEVTKYFEQAISKVADKFKPKKGDEKFDFKYPFFIGKADIVVDILKMFEPLEL